MNFNEACIKVFVQNLVLKTIPFETPSAKWRPFFVQTLVHCMWNNFPWIKRRPRNRTIDNKFKSIFANISILWVFIQLCQYFFRTFYQHGITHWGRVTHICVGKLTIISPGRRQAIIWTNAKILLIGPIGIKLNENLFEMYAFWFEKISASMW